MKHLLKVFLLVFVLSLPVHVHAGGGGAVGGAASAVYSALIYAQQLRDSVAMSIAWAQQYIQMANSIRNSYHQLQHMIELERRALLNLRSLLDVRSARDFMNWTNRQVFLARQSEATFNRMRVNIGGRNYTMRQIEDIPEALANQFRDPFSGSLSESERRRVWTQMGLSPGNYAYLRTWQRRSENAALRIMTYSEILHEEHEEAAARNEQIMRDYSAPRSNDNEIQEREIMMNTHVTLMNTEMAIRDQTRIMVEIAEYQQAMDRKRYAPPTPVRFSDSWGTDPFGSITDGHGTSTFSW